MYCGKCGTEVDNSYDYCPECGASLNTPSEPRISKKKSKASIVILFFVFSIIALISSILFVYANSPERRYQRQLDLGYKYIAELEYEQAIACFEAAIAIDPKQPDGYLGLIDTYSAWEDPEGVLSVYAMAEENLEKSGVKRVEKAISVAITSMVESAIDSEEYELAEELAESLGEVSEKESEKLFEEIDESRNTDPDVNDPGSSPISNSGSVEFDLTQKGSDVRIMLDLFADSYFPGGWYIYQNDFSYTSDSLFTEWEIRSFIRNYALCTQSDTYREELNQTEWYGNSVVTMFNSDQINLIASSLTGINQNIDYNTSYSSVEYVDGYYIFNDVTTGSYVNGYTDLEYYSTRPIADGKVVVNAGLILNDWNGFGYKTGDLEIELSENPDSIFAGYSISKVTLKRTDGNWKSAYLTATEDVYTDIFEKWNSVPSLKNISIWDHIGFYMEYINNDGYPDVVVWVDGPSDYVNKFDAFTVMSYNGSFVETSSYKQFDIDFSVYIKYTYADALMLFSDGEYGMGMEKPNIYIYPDCSSQHTTMMNDHPVVETQVSLTINSGTLTTSWPEAEVADGTYNWNVYAAEDGTLYDCNGDEYSYIFWEGNSTWSPDFSTGFCVRGEDTADFLRQVLSEMGLTPREYNEFIVYWAPRMQNNEYNLISFQDTNYQSACPLNITDSEGNTPDSILRVMMAWKPVDQEVYIEPQVFDDFDRDGFTVVEWGGRECK